MNRYRPLAGLVLLSWLALAGCQSTPPAEVAQATPEPNTPTAVPSDTPTPTETAEPTATFTPVPTDTPEPTATFTPRPTITPRPTRTQRPTSTPAPTNTPGPTFTPKPSPTATTDPNVPESITIYYISNPADILGVFPVRPFDANALYNNMLNIRGSLYGMRDSIPGAQGGDPAACATYIGSYENILYSGVFYEPVPADWQDVDYLYFLSFIYALDRTRPAYLSCVNAGIVDEFNAGLASVTIDETLNVLNEAIAAAAGRL
jgi:hypothetical protein